MISKEQQHQFVCATVIARSRQTERLLLVLLLSSLSLMHIVVVFDQPMAGQYRRC